MKPETLTFLSVDDVVRSGACREGVTLWRDDHFAGYSVVDVGTALSCADDKDRVHIERAAGIVGDGVGDGDGDGNGYGNGYGYGNGNGYGYGYGDGNGNGNGNGYGNGYG